MFDYGTYGRIAEKYFIAAINSYRVNEFSIVCIQCALSVEQILKHYISRKSSTDFSTRVKSIKDVRKLIALAESDIFNSEYDLIIKISKVDHDVDCEREKATQAIMLVERLLDAIKGI